MLVTFTSNSYSDITMFGTAAVALLKLMGQSGNVPGAIMAEDVPAALAKLKEELEKLSVQDTDQPSVTDNASDFDDNEEKEAHIGLDKRAGPLISLLEAAATAHQNVLWDGQ